MRRFDRSFALAIILAIGSPMAYACTCVNWDPKYFAKEMAVVFVADVASIDDDNPESVTWNERPSKAVPFKIEVVELLKGAVPGDGQFLAVGYEYACSPYLRKGERRIFLLPQAVQRTVSLCNVQTPANEKILGLRNALKDAK